MTATWLTLTIGEQRLQILWTTAVAQNITQVPGWRKLAPVDIRAVLCLTICCHKYISCYLLPCCFHGLALWCHLEDGFCNCTFTLTSGTECCILIPNLASQNVLGLPLPEIQLIVNAPGWIQVTHFFSFPRTTEYFKKFSFISTLHLCWVPTLILFPNDTFSILHFLIYIGETFETYDWF